MTLDAWIAALCEELDVPVDDVDTSAILDLAKDAAHNVERPAAPITAFIAGYAAAIRGGGSAEVDAAVEAAAELAAEWPQRDAGPVADAPTLDSADNRSAPAATTSAEPEED
ncbi:DUF6457 domain-containing protein [Phytoactinopolyspora halotolerans]|uniref:DUF6457 domain-containing protein n=1 Tax=Phytoactinopolyspora halotolerans TaxID=1981512 RepID=UPI001C208C06|nr:DUF6457 domain-containing protein [Phytoactinopolyspora halotolerans]